MDVVGATKHDTIERTGAATGVRQTSYASWL